MIHVPVHKGEIETVWADVNYPHPYESEWEGIEFVKLPPEVRPKDVIATLVVEREGLPDVTYWQLPSTPDLMQAARTIRDNKDEAETVVDSLPHPRTVSE